jgi:hypothetical protein
LARAPALQAGGHRFDSDILHQKTSSFLDEGVIRGDKSWRIDWFETDTSATLSLKGDGGKFFDILGIKVVIPR